VIEADFDDGGLMQTVHCTHVKPERFYVQKYRQVDQLVEPAAPSDLPFQFKQRNTHKPQQVLRAACFSTCYVKSVALARRC
jgi:hypothetical protein